MTSAQPPVSPLRQRMIDDMRMRQLSPKTQASYLRIVREFARYLGRSPDTATVEDLRGYQLHLVDHGTSTCQPIVGFAATRPTSGRLCLSRHAASRTSTSTSSSPSRQCIASSRRLGASSILFEPPSSNNAEDAGPSIATATRNSEHFGPLRGFLPRGLFDACPRAPRHTHSHVNEGRRRTTLNDDGPMQSAYTTWNSQARDPYRSFAQRARTSVSLSKAVVQRGAVVFA